MTEKTKTELVVAGVEGPQLVARFRGQGFEDLISKIEKEARSHVADVSTAKGRDAVKSLAYKVSRSKTGLDKMGKDLNDDARKAIESVDAERRKIRDRLDALRDEVRAPLSAWEKAEEDRKAKMQAALDTLKLDNVTPESSTADISAAIQKSRKLRFRKAYSKANLITVSR